MQMKKIISSKIPNSTTILPLQQLFFTGKMHLTTTEQKLNNPFLFEFIQTPAADYAQSKRWCK
jgi:hypothetical protein